MADRPVDVVAATLHQLIGGDDYCTCRDECRDYARATMETLAEMQAEMERVVAEALECEGYESIRGPARIAVAAIVEWLRNSATPTTVGDDAEPLMEAIVQRLELKPGEVVVLTFPGRLDFDRANSIKDAWATRFPDNQCVVIGDGGRVTGVLAEGRHAAGEPSVHVTCRTGPSEFVSRRPHQPATGDQ